MGCHLLDLPFWALDLKYPTTVETVGPPVHPEMYPRWLIRPLDISCSEQPAAGGTHLVRRRKETTDVGGRDLSQLVRGRFVRRRRGDADSPILADTSCIPGRSSPASNRPRRRFPDPSATLEEWLTACKTGSPTGTHFGYSGPLTETVLLGTVAYRTGQKLEWDAENLKVTNCPEANEYIQREYRKGWTL